MTQGRMQARARGKGRGGSSGGGHPRGRASSPSTRITEQQHDDAMRVLRAEYYQAVRGVAHELADRVKDGEIKDQDGFQQALNESVDGSYWVIYTHANFQVLLCSDHHDAYVEDFGEPPVQNGDINWAALAYGALMRDVQDQISAEGIEPDWNDRGRLEVSESRRGRYQVLVLGDIISTHRTERAAISAAIAECLAAGLYDDGVYSSDDGWPTIVDTMNPDRRIDYPAPEAPEGLEEAPRHRR